MKNALLTLIMLLGILSCNAQSLFDNEIQFDFDNLFNHESLKLRIYFYDDGTVGGEATHILPAEFGMLDEESEIQTIDQKKLIYPFFTNDENSLFLKKWLNKIDTIEFGKSLLNYRSTTDGTYGELTIKKGENILTIGIRNFDNYKINNLYHWISELINHLGINSKELFN